MEARRLLQQLMTALHFAHERGVANRDVKVRVVCYLWCTSSTQLKPTLFSTYHAAAQQSPKNLEGPEKEAMINVSRQP